MAIFASGHGTTTTVLHGNAAGDPAYSAVVLTTDVSGTLPATNGGTGLSAYALGDTLYASAANTLSKLTKAAADGALLQQSSSIPAWLAIGASDTYLRSTGTAPAWFTNPYAEATTTAGQSIGNSAFAAVVFGTEAIDTDNAYNNTTGVFTCPAGKAGQYQVSAVATFSAGPGADVVMSIFKGGTRTVDLFNGNSSVNWGAGGTAVSGSGVITLAAADTIDVRVFQSSGVAVTLSTNAFANRLTIKRLG